MKILIFSDTLGVSGGVRQAMYQAQGLLDMGHDVSLCLPENSAMWTVGDNTSHWRALPADKAQWSLFLQSLFAQDGKTIVHAFHRAVNYCSWHGLFWKNALCVSHRGVIFRPKNFLVYWGGAIKKVIANSTACGRSFGPMCPPWKIEVVPNALPQSRITPHISREEAYQRANIPTNAFVWGFVGNDNPVKGIDHALRAFGKLHRQCSGDLVQVLLVVGSHGEQWQNLCQELDLVGKVYFVPPLPHVADYLQIMDAFLFTSVGMDSMPNVVLEALSMGLPILASKVGGVPDMLPAEALFQPGNVDACVALMKQIVGPNGWKQHLEKINLQHAPAYSVKTRCRHLENIYQALLSKAN